MVYSGIVFVTRKKNLQKNLKDNEALLEQIRYNGNIGCFNSIFYENIKGIVYDSNVRAFSGELIQYSFFLFFRQYIMNYPDMETVRELNHMSKDKLEEFFDEEFIKHNVCGVSQLNYKTIDSLIGVNFNDGKLDRYILECIYKRKEPVWFPIQLYMKYLIKFNLRAMPSEIRFRRKFHTYRVLVRQFKHDNNIECRRINNDLKFLNSFITRCISSDDSINLDKHSKSNILQAIQRHIQNLKNHDGNEINEYNAILENLKAFNLYFMDKQEIL